MPIFNRKNLTYLSELVSRSLTDDKVALEHTWQEIEKIVGQKNREYNRTSI